MKRVSFIILLLLSTSSFAGVAFTYGARLEGFFWDGELGHVKSIEAGFDHFHLTYSLYNYDLLGLPFHELSVGYDFRLWRFYLEPGVAFFANRKLQDAISSPVLAVEYPLIGIGTPNRNGFQHKLNLRVESNLFFKYYVALGVSYGLR